MYLHTFFLCTAMDKRTRSGSFSLLPYFVFLFFSVFSVSVWANSSASKRTVLSAEVYGYKRDMVYFGCAQTPFISAEFHTNPGEEHHYAFELAQLAELDINGQLRLLLEPGDSLKVVVKYEGRGIQSVDFSGTERVVAANRLFWSIEQARRQMRYKTNLLGNVALDIAPKQQIESSKAFLAHMQGMVKAANESVSANVATYLLADTEAAVELSKMEYPVMYADVRKKPIEQQEIGDYSTIMKDFQPRKSVVALSNPSYASMLMRYCFYSRQQVALSQGKPYEAPKRMEDMFEAVASFYEGDQRDYTLFLLLCNFIRQGKEMDRVDAPLAIYREKYNRNKSLLEIIDSLLQ